MCTDMNSVSSNVVTTGMIDFFEYFPSFIVVVRIEDNHIEYVNHVARLIFGESAMGKCFDDVFSGTSMHERYLKNIKEQRNTVYDESINNKWYQINEANIKWIDGKAARIIVGIDITEVKNSERQMAISASTDLMTGIHNRQAGLDFLNYFIEDVNNSGTNFSVCYIDINDLKYVNDTYGHAKGDEYIMTFVSCVKSSTRKTDIFARLGGDEFLIILPNCRYEIAENILGIVTNKLNFINESENKMYSVSFGIMEITTETTLDPEYILSAVDSKMYYMKEEFKKNRKPLS